MTHAVEPPVVAVPKPQQLGVAEQVEQLRSSILLINDACCRASRGLCAKATTTTTGSGRAS